MTILAMGQRLYVKKGDTGNILFKNLPKDKNYNVYMSVYNPDTELIINETLATSFNQADGIATFSLGADFTNDLPAGDWVYGLKICADGTEDTLIPRAYIDDSGELITEPAPAFIVDTKYVEGD